MMALQKVAQSRGNWVRESEHLVLRFVSLVFSVGSAYAVRWFFEPLDAGDPIHYVLWWVVAIGFGLLGFYLSRSLMHRMMAKESFLAYVPLFMLVEFFEVLCNYAKAVTVVSGGKVSWVVHAPVGQQSVMMFLTYIGWSIIPLVSPMMAVADMDMTRRRNGEIGVQKQRSGFQGSQARPQPSPGNPAPKQPLQRPGGNGAQQQPPMGSRNGAQSSQQYQPQQAGATNGVNPPPGVSRN